MRIIDFHTHIYPDSIAQKAADDVRMFYDGIGDTTIDGRIRTLLEHGEKAGITDYVVLPVATKPDRTRHINEFILKQTCECSQFHGFGTIHVGMKDLMDEVSFIMNNGLHGIKVHPDYQLFNIDDPRMFPVYEEIQDKIPIIIHMGDLRYSYSHPQKLKRVLNLFPHLQAIAAHFGGYQMYEIAREELTDTNCYFDTSSSLMFMEPGVAESYIQHYGAERFLYGSDFPMWNPERELERFFALNISDDQKEQICWKTAVQLLKI